MVSTYFSLLCTSRRLTFAYASHTCAHRYEHTRESHVRRHAYACVRSENIFDAACPDVSKLSLYIDYRAVLDREESRLSSRMHELNLRKKVLRATSAIDIQLCNVPHPPRFIVATIPWAIVASCTCRRTYKQRNPWT